MKFLVSCLFLVCVVPVSSAHAGPVVAGDTVVLSDSFGTTGGGEFILRATDDPLSAFLTFCLQRTEFISFGEQYVVNAISTFTDDEPQDELDSRTAWLYTQFRAGTLAGYIYGNGLRDVIGHTVSANLLQLAIWGFEGELALDLSNPFVQLANAFTPVDFGLGNVRVLNLYRNGVKAQDQLTLVQPVPEPSTLILIGSGLAAAAYRRRRRQSTVAHS